ncbi:MAG: P1 family peptidase [Chloroflexi bacterium]|nr:P1 family peptidase [Chloroflexota bacterium]
MMQVGHYTDKVGVTGCTVVLCEQGAVAGVDVRGSAPGTRETDLLRPMNLVQEVHAILLAGGSAFGLGAADGVMRYLEERGYGFDAGMTKVPIVPAAIIFDLAIGDAKARPGPDAGYEACLATTNQGIAEGSIGAGTGATIGKALGMERATKGGLGIASLTLENNVVVSALVVVNAMGDVIDPETGATLAGPRGESGFISTLEILRKGQGHRNLPLQNTTLGVVTTNAYLTKEQANKLAQMAHDGLARAVRPAHTMADGDVIFALSLGKDPQVKVDLTTLGAMAAEVVATAIVRGIRQAESLGGIPAVKDLSLRN